MTQLVRQAMAAIATLSEEHQDEVARVIMTEAKRLAVLEGIAAADSGDLVPHEEMKAWLESWGTEHETPPLPCK